MTIILLRRRAIRNAPGTPLSRVQLNNGFSVELFLWDEYAKRLHYTRRFGYIWCVYIISIIPSLRSNLELGLSEETWTNESRCTVVSSAITT